MIYSVFSYLVLLSTSVFASDYRPVQDQPWKSCERNYHVAEYGEKLYSVSYSFCTVGGGISVEDIRPQLKRSTQLIFEFAKSRGYKGEQCVANSKLEIYDVKLETLNDPGRFPAWTNASPNGIIGLYDPRINDYNTSSLILTGSSDKWKLIFAHELSHYWYDRLCWNKYDPDPERFAMDFERFYNSRSK